MQTLIPTRLLLFLLLGVEVDLRKFIEQSKNPKGKRWNVDDIVNMVTAENLCSCRDPINMAFQVHNQIYEEEEEEPLLIYTTQGSPFRRKKLSVINGSPEQQRTKTTLNI